MPSLIPWRRKRRFRGTGGSAEKRFRSERRANIRETWYAWLGAALAAIGSDRIRAFDSGAADRVSRLDLSLPARRLMALSTDRAPHAESAEIIGTQAGSWT